MTAKDVSVKLLEIRRNKAISKYALVKGGLNFGTIQSLESGGNFTIGNLIKYCNAIGAEISIKEKEER